MPRFNFDRLVVVDADDTPIAFFYSQANNYLGLATVIGIRRYTDADGLFVESEIEAVIGSGACVNVTVSGRVNQDGQLATRTKRYGMLVASRLLFQALSGTSAQRLVGKNLEIGGTDIVIESAKISQKATFR